MEYKIIREKDSKIKTKIDVNQSEKAPTKFNISLALHLLSYL
jgi:hypothetical protein